MDISFIHEFAQFGLAGLLVCFLLWWLTHTFTLQLGRLRHQIERHNDLLLLLTASISKIHHIDLGEIRTAVAHEKEAA